MRLFGKYGKETAVLHAGNKLGTPTKELPVAMGIPTRGDSLALAGAACPLRKGHQALALFADSLEQNYARHEPLSEGTDSAGVWSDFCADRQALAGLGLEVATFLAWTERVVALVEQEADNAWLVPLRAAWGVEVPLALQTHAIDGAAERHSTPEGSRNTSALQRARRAAHASKKKTTPTRASPTAG